MAGVAYARDGQAVFAAIDATISRRKFHLTILTDMQELDQTKFLQMFDSARHVIYDLATKSKIADEDLQLYLTGPVEKDGRYEWRIDGLVCGDFTTV